MEKTRDELEYQRLKLKRWEQKFEAKYARGPEPSDISKYPEVGSYSHILWNIFNVLNGRDL